MTRSCVSCVPCAKLMRTTSTPISARAWILSRSAVAGPTVATIFVRTAGSAAVNQLSAHERRDAADAADRVARDVERVGVPDGEIGAPARRDLAELAARGRGQSRAVGVAAPGLDRAEPFRRV